VRITSLALPAVIVASVLIACSSSSSSGGTPKKDAGAGDGRTHDYPSFSDDVMAVVVKNCALAACHGSQQSNLNIYLPGDPAVVYSEFQKTSPTTGLKFIEPGNPDQSYVMLKLDGKQGTLGSKCPSGNCGTEMPPGDPDGTLIPQDERDAVRAWISAGAKND
jgi:hypothetical protein